MGKTSGFPGIETGYPSLNPPAASEMHIVAGGRDYNLTVPQVFSIVAALDAPEEFKAMLPSWIDEALSGSGWRGAATGGDILLLDEDNFASDSATAAPSQQSTKAYVDNAVAGKAAASHTHSIANITNLQTELDGKLSAGDAAVTNARALADGDYGIVTVASGVWSVNDGVIALADMAPVSTKVFLGRLTTGSGAVEAMTPENAIDVLQTASPASLGGFATAILAEATTEIGVLTYADVLDGTSFITPFTPDTDTIINGLQEVTYATTVTLDHSATGNVTSRLLNIECTGNCAVVFDNIPDYYLHKTVELTFTNTSGGSITVGPTIGTTNGVAVTNGDGAANPGIGTAAGDTLTVFLWFKSTTAVVCRSYQKA